MTDWSAISVAEFDAAAAEDARDVSLLVGQMILDRLPFAFSSKDEYFYWRDRLARGLDVDARDVLLVGTAMTGRSLSRDKGFKQFDSRSDVDVVVISPSHFDQAWTWFRNTNPQIVGLDADAQIAFNAHRDHMVFDGVIGADSFLSYFSFGPQWLRELQHCNEYLPKKLQGRPTSVRIYRDSAAVRTAQARVFRDYREYLGKSDPMEGAPA